MNHIVPIFGMEEDGTILSSEFFSQKKSSMQDDELMEILWKNGQVVMQNHNQRPLRKSPPPPPKLRVEDAVLPVPPEKSATSGQVESSKAPEGQLFIHEDEMASWLHYPLDEPLDRDFCADLLYHPPPGSSQVVADRRPEIKPAAASSRPPVSPARRTDADNSNLLNLGLFSRTKGKDESRLLVSDKTGRESTVVDSSVTPSVGPGSPRFRVSAGGGATTGSGGNFWSEGTCGRSPETEMGTCDTMMTSSSGGSGASGNPPPKPSSGEDRKRKAREGDEFEGLCEDAEFEAVEEKKVLHRSASTRRTRSAEVHNLSERRRRDRINEKMKALQELIPRCNKTDKASMLDEAIEYLKSLQLQVQMMSMGCSMGPMMFPGVQQYMQPMGMGMGMGTGMGMGMDMTTAAGLNRPMFPFPPVLPTTHLPGHAASHMVPRFPMPPFHMQHIPPSTQSRAQSTSHPNAACNLVGLQRPIQLQLPTMDDPYKHYRDLQYMQVPLHQTQAMTPQSSISNGAETPQNYKSR